MFYHGSKLCCTIGTHDIRHTTTSISHEHVHRTGAMYIKYMSRNRSEIHIQDMRVSPLICSKSVKVS